MLNSRYTSCFLPENRLIDNDVVMLRVADYARLSIRGETLNQIHTKTTKRVQNPVAVRVADTMPSVCVSEYVCRVRTTQSARQGNRWTEVGNDSVCRINAEAQTLSILLLRGVRGHYMKYSLV